MTGRPHPERPAKAADEAIRLGVNIDHVATLRNARGGASPDPLRAAQMALAAGADGITAHLREDRRHIVDDDMRRLKETISSAAQFRNGGDRADARHCAEDPAARLLPGAGKAHRTHHRRRPRRGRRRDQLAPSSTSFRAPASASRCSSSRRSRRWRPLRSVSAPVVELHTGAWCNAAAPGEDEARGGI